MHFPPFCWHEDFTIWRDCIFYELIRPAIWSSDRPTIATILLHLGSTASLQKDDNKAEVYLREGLTLARESEKNDYVCQLLIQLGKIAMRREDFEQAKTYLQEAVTLAQQSELHLLSQALSEWGDLKRLVLRFEALQESAEDLDGYE